MAALGRLTDEFTDTVVIAARAVAQLPVAVKPHDAAVQAMHWPLPTVGQLPDSKQLAY
jgi:hypothetical protein